MVRPEIQRKLSYIIAIQAWMYKMPFAASKILGEITFFYEDFGTDKEFVEEKILELGVTCYSTQHHESKPSKAGERRFFFGDFGTDKEF